ncbi:MAG: hypothetical protein WAO58_11275 [Fimbriimonadaceae bacterium]
MRKLTATALFVLSLWSQSGAESKYKVFDTGVEFNPNSIGEGGMMAGYARGSFAYDRSVGLSEIPPFQGWQIWAEDVNASGTVVGSTFYNSLEVSFTWNRANGTSVLDDFNGVSHQAFGINDHGDVVGRYFPDAGNPIAYMWRPGQGWINLPPKYGGACGAMKINNAREILGYTQVDQDTTTIVIWRPDGTIVDMGNMAPQYQNFAFDINNNGYVCGGSFGPLGNVGYIWNPNGETYTTIYNPYSSGSFIDATGLNDSNAVIGSLIIDGVGWKGYIRYPNGTIKLLNSLLDSSSQEWDVREAWDINNKGQISAAAYKNGQRRGVLLQPVKDKTPISIGGVGR